MPPLWELWVWLSALGRYPPSAVSGLETREVHIPTDVQYTTSPGLSISLLLEPRKARLRSGSGLTPLGRPFALGSASHLQEDLREGSGSHQGSASRALSLICQSISKPTNLYDALHTWHCCGQWRYEGDPQSRWPPSGGLPPSPPTPTAPHTRFQRIPSTFPSSSLLLTPARWCRIQPKHSFVLKLK